MFLSFERRAQRDLSEQRGYMFFDIIDMLNILVDVVCVRSVFMVGFARAGGSNSC